MEELSAFINSLKTNQERLSGCDEVVIKQTIILRSLQLLGWNIFDYNEVTPEYTIERGRVDYSLRINGKSKVFIEVKRPSEDLGSHQKQLLDYSFQEGVGLAILTNGITWWFYLPLEEGNWEQRKFYTINISEQETGEVSSKIVDFLSRDNVENGLSIKKAKDVLLGGQKQRILEETLPKAWNKLVSEQDDALVQLINDTIEKLCGYRADEQQIKKFLIDKIDNKSSSNSNLQKKPDNSQKGRRQKSIDPSIKNGELQINTRTLKVEKQNAKAFIEGFLKDSKRYYSTIFTAHQNAISMQNDFRSSPKLLTTKRGQPRKEYPLSSIGKNLCDKQYKLRGKYVAVLDRIFHIKNDINVWEILCNCGIFDIWDPEAPYNSLSDKTYPMILLLRIFEIDRDFSNEIKEGIYSDSIPGGKVKIIRPIIPNNKDDTFSEEYDGCYRFDEIIDKISSEISKYIKEVKILSDTTKYNQG